jgi:hypothetical protein
MRNRRPTGRDRFSHGHAASAAGDAPAPDAAPAASAGEAGLEVEAEQAVTAADSITATKPATTAIPRQRSLTGRLLAERNSFIDGLPLVGR